MKNEIQKLSDGSYLVKLDPESVEEKEALARGGHWVESYIHKAVSQKLGSDHSVLSADEKMAGEYFVEVATTKGIG